MRMDFQQYKELENFIKSRQLVSGFVRMSEINFGGSSYNFCVTTETGKFLLKLMKNETDYVHLQSVLDQLGIKGLPFQQHVWRQYFLLTMPFYAGHKLRYKDCSDEVLCRLWLVYADFLQKAEIMDRSLVLGEGYIAEKVRMVDQSMQNYHGLFKNVLQHYWKMLERDISASERFFYKNVIHGDFTENNILIDEEHNIHMIDFDFIRKGNVAQDLAGLSLQLAGFRGLYGHIHHFKRLYAFFQKVHPLSYDDWLCGVRIFYLDIIQRRLNICSKTVHSIRKKICLLLILYGYFRIKKFLHKQSI